MTENETTRVTVEATRVVTFGIVISLVTAFIVLLPATGLLPASDIYPRATARV